jgi:hypothetical protein
MNFPFERTHNYIAGHMEKSEREKIKKQLNSSSPHTKQTTTTKNWAICQPSNNSFWQLGK